MLNNRFTRLWDEMNEGVQNRDSWQDLENNCLLKLIRDDEQFGCENAMTFLRHLVVLGEWDAFLRVTVDIITLNSTRNGLLHEAAKYGHCRTLAKFMDELNVNQSNGHGDTPLHFAVEYGHTEDVEILITKRATLAVDSEGYTPLHLAVMSSKPRKKIVHKLLALSPDTLLNAQTGAGKNTVLHLAAANVNMTSDVIAQLKDINPLIANSEEETAFHVAAKSENPKLILWLLRTFATAINGRNIVATRQNDGRPTLMDICVNNGNAVGVAALIQHGADVSEDLLHIIIVESEKHPDKTASFKEVLQALFDNVVLWNCMRTNRRCPRKNSREFHGLQQEVLGRLLYTRRHLNAITVIEQLSYCNSPDILTSFANNCWGIAAPVNDVRDNGRLTLIDLCVTKGNAVGVAALMQHGADVSEDLLHTIIVESEKHPDKIASFGEVLQAVIDNVVLWNCMRINRRCPLANSIEFNLIQRKVLGDLMMNARPNQGEFTVLKRLSRCGSSDILTTFVKLLKNHIQGMFAS
jgi:hypothetical protein